MDSHARERFEQRVKALEAFGHRGSATDNEAKAADYLVETFETIGLTAEQEAFSGSSTLGNRLLAHLVVALIGTSLLWFVPLLTVLLNAAALISLFVEGTTRNVLLSRIFLGDSSQNVVARISSPSPPRARIVVLAHYDTQRTGIIWKEGLAKRMGPLLHRLPGVMKSPFFLVVVAMILSFLLGVLALFGVSHIILSAFCGLALFVLVLASALVLSWGFGRFVPGANDNATGTATVLAVAEQSLKNPPEDVELVFLLTGCEESGLLGAAAWAVKHKDDIDAVPTRFINIDGTGYGRPRFVGKEHAISCMPFTYPYDIVSLCSKVADDLELVDAGPKELPVLTDGLALLAHGIPGATITAFDDGGHLPNYHQMTDTSDRMDFDVAWKAAEFTWAVFEKMVE